MKNKWNWVLVIMIAIILSVIVQYAGDLLLTSAWGSVAINLISDFFFVFVAASIIGLLYWLRSSRAMEFFGIELNVPLQIVISTHVDDETTTGRVFTAEEYEVAEELRNALQRQFPSIFTFLAGLFGIDMGPIDVIIKGSPIEDLNEYQFHGGLIVLGGPTRNKVANFFAKRVKPIVVFDDSKKSFLIRQDTEDYLKKAESSHDLALVQKLLVDGKVVIIAFGFGETGTSIAARELANNWRNLQLTHSSRSFSRLLSLDDGEIIQRRDYHDASHSSTD